MNKILSLILLFILVSCNGGSPSTSAGFGSTGDGQTTPTPTPGAVSAAQSTITTTSTPLSDGISAALVKITLKDSSSIAVPNVTPTYTASDTDGLNIYGPCSPSNNLGESFCSFTSKRAEVKTLSITSPVNTTGGTVTFVPGPAVAANSSIGGTSEILANGTAFSDVVITLQDAGENAVAGVVPTFTATDTGNDNVYGTCSATDANGNSNCRLYSLTPEIKTLRITSPIFLSDSTVKFLSPGMNIMVPIDLIDRGVSSNTAAIIFDRSLYPLTTTDYVATSTDYYFEIIASNANVTNAYTVNLLGNANAVLATITIPASTTAYTRFRSTAITMPAGTNNLKIRVNATAAANNVIVLAGKLLIKQVAATKTKLWIPLSHYDHTGYANTAVLSVFQNALTTHTNNTTYTVPWNRNDSLYTELDSSAYKFEALLASNNAAGNSSAVLYNNTDSVAVAGSAVSVTGTTMAWASAPLADSSSFANSKNYEVRLKSNSTSYTAYLFKAGVSVALTNLSKVEIANRLYMRRSATTSAMLSGGRIMWEAADYAHPKTFMEFYGSISVGGSGSRELDDMATSDNNVATPVVVTDSVLNLTTTNNYLRTPELSLTEGNRVIVYDRVNSGTSTLNATWLVIKSTLR